MLIELYYGFAMKIPCWSQTYHDKGGGELVIERIHHKPETRANFNDPFSGAVRNNLKLPVKIISSLVGELARWKRADL